VIGIMSENNLLGKKKYRYLLGICHPLEKSKNVQMKGKCGGFLLENDGLGKLLKGNTEK
jgi:hypothetical protein